MSVQLKKGGRKARKVERGMFHLELYVPTADMKDAALAYRQEHFDAGEIAINGDGGLDEAATYEEWLEKIGSEADPDSEVLVPADTYFAVVDNRIVGTIQIRYRLNAYLANYGGHIGYGIRPTERRKGYAAEMLAQALIRCREKGLLRVLITCDADNEGSARTMMRNGGVFESEVIHPDGHVIRRYWIQVAEIRPIRSEEMGDCVEVIRKSFTPVAAAFGITAENCPSHTSFMTVEKLSGRYASGSLMYVLLVGERIAGFFTLFPSGEPTYELGNFAVLPAYRHRGFGRQILCYAKGKVRELGASKIAIGIIEDHAVLKAWYEKNGFVSTGTERFEHLPFTVGFMEWS